MREQVGSRGCSATRRGPRGPPIAPVLFADLSGFTVLSERLDPEDVRALQTDLFSSAAASTEDSWTFVVSGSLGGVALLTLNLFGLKLRTGDSSPVTAQQLTATSDAVPALATEFTCACQTASVSIQGRSSTCILAGSASLKGTAASASKIA